MSRYHQMNIKTRHLLESLSPTIILAVIKTIIKFFEKAPKGLINSLPLPGFDQKVLKTPD